MLASIFYAGVLVCWLLGIAGRTILFLSIGSGGGGDGGGGGGGGGGGIMVSYITHLINNC